MHTLSLLFVALGLLGTVAAQSLDAAARAANDAGDPARRVPLTAGTVAIEGIVTDVASDGTLWVAGGAWKASFAAAGTTFVPCFGASAPRNFPAQIGRAAVNVAGRPLATDAVAPVFGDDRAEFRGAAFTERYLFLDAGIEQQFVFDTLPARGAIEVEVPFTGELAVASMGAAGGFRFAGQYGTYEYGRAVAVDATGRRLELATDWTGNGFRIRVPAAFVAEARLPLVVDPLIGNVVSFANDTRVIVATDLAWDESMSRYALVHERQDSATDSDVYVRLLDGSMQGASGAFAIDLSLDSWRAPHVAGLEAHDTFLVVAERSVGNVAPFTGFGRVVNGLTPNVQPSFQLFGTNLVHHLDVGGDPSPVGPSHFCIVAEYDFSPTDHDIVYDIRDAGGNSVYGGTVDSTGTFEFGPRISKSCGMPGASSEGWGIAYLRDVGSGLSQPMFSCLRRGAFLFSVARQPWPITVPAANCSVAVSSPTDAAQGRRYLVCAQYDGPSYQYSRGYVFDRTGAQIAETGVFSSGTPIAGEASIDCDGTRFVIANCHRTPGSASPWVSFNLFGIAGSSLAYEESAGVGLSAEMAPSVVARRSGGGSDRAYGFAWVNLLTATTSRLQCSGYDGIQSGVQLSVRYTSCGGLGFLSGGESVLGGTVSMQLATNQGLLGWVVGMPVDLPLGICPGCRQGVDGSAVFSPSYSFTVPRNAAFVGATVAFQGFQFVSAGNGACLGQINLSNTLDVTIR